MGGILFITDIFMVLFRSYSIPATSALLPGTNIMASILAASELKSRAECFRKIDIQQLINNVT